ncbi:alpha/beta hydrolase, partial [Mycobacterium tuberculosis]
MSKIAKFFTTAVFGAAVVAAGGAATATAATQAKPGIVLVHGGFVDGSGWEGVY